MNETPPTPVKKPAKTPVVYVCTNLRLSGHSCKGNNAQEVLSTLQAKAKERADNGHVEVDVKPSVCMGYCGEGPNVKVIGGAFYHGVDPDAVDDILDAAEKIAAQP